MGRSRQNAAADTAVDDVVAVAKLKNINQKSDMAEADNLEVGKDFGGLTCEMVESKNFPSEDLLNAQEELKIAKLHTEAVQYWLVSINQAISIVIRAFVSLLILAGFTIKFTEFTEIILNILKSDDVISKSIYAALGLGVFGIRAMKKK